MRELKHPAVLSLEAVYESQDYVFLVSELYNGGEIFHKNFRTTYGSPVPQEKCKRIMLGLMKGLAYLEGKRIAHRDIKPANILFKENSQNSPVVIVDFGLSTKINSEKDYIEKKCGTAGFIAPEIMNLSPGDQPNFTTLCDVFSAGLIFYLL